MSVFKHSQFEHQLMLNLKNDLFLAIGLELILVNELTQTINYERLKIEDYV